MARIWCASMIVSCIVALMNGCADEAAKCILASGDNAVGLAMTLLSSMILWNGLLEILNETGDVQRLGRILRRIAAPLFPGLMDEESWSAMSMNISANVLGLGNAATPAGIEAAKRLAAQGDAGMSALAMLLVINNAGLQLMPTTVISLRQAAGSADPAAIWLPTLMTSMMSTATGVGLMWLIRKGGQVHGRHDRHRAHRSDSADRSPGDSCRM